MSELIKGKRLSYKALGYIALIALSTLFYELSLIRILDILWYPHFAYMVITLALLGFGISGVVTSVIAEKKFLFSNTTTLWLTLLLALSYSGIYFFLNRFHIDFDNFSSVAYLGAKVALVFSGLVIPFFLGGFILSIQFTKHAEMFGKLYFWDLFGASLGCLLVPLLIPALGGPGMLFVASAITLVAISLVTRSKVFTSISLIAAICISGFLISRGDDYLEIDYHMDKRGFKSLQGGKILTKWDRISRIDLIQYRDAYIWVAYDGGTQTSYFYKFDGDYVKLRESLPEKARDQFWDKFVFASHWLKEGSHPNVLIIGAAGGQETKGAVAFGANSVDAVEMVGSVIELGKTKYAIEPYTNEKVNAVRGEGRSFLRASKKQYDIIQMMSNHTTSSIASGSGAVSPNYLQTTDAYKEYFSHLTNNGVLHINHHIYPKMVLTAAKAWKEMGRENFENHFLLYYANQWYNLPTLLIKMEPWTKEEVDRVDALMHEGFELVHNPIDPGSSRLDKSFFTGTLSPEIEASIPYRIEVPTDDKPFFNHIRKRLAPVSFKEQYVDTSIKVLLNDSIKHGLPMDIIHLIVSAGAALAIAVVCLFGPLLFSKVGRAQWKGKFSFIGYFACLGSGFIAIELVFIQLFHKLVGFPLYTYVTVVFAFLLSAGIGSYVTDISQLEKKRVARFIPFLLIPIYGLTMLYFKESLLDYFLQWPTAVRMLAAFVLIAPLGFFMGMPFAVGIAGSHKNGKGAVGWAWAVNGLFTVLGGVVSVVMAIYVGFFMTLAIALSLYLVAGVLLPRFSTE
ncbi:spermidine synthase family protein [Desulforhopalus sp. 52FAK]